LTGEPLWTIQYPAPGKMDYTNAPRATPVIAGNRVILQGAFGALICASITDGTILWQRNLVTDFAGELPSWGYCVPPLVERDRVIVAPGGKQHAVIALRLSDAKQLWSTEGHAAAYAPMIHATFGNREQVIGYDSASLAGWDFETGERIWELIPPDNSDFHVGTPVPLANGLLLATENNATRVYRFEERGRLLTEPLNVNDDCAPDTCTPVISGDRAFCSAYGELFCLDAANDYSTLWSQPDDRFYDHTCLIASDARLLLWSSSCDLLLLDSRADECKILSEVRPMKDPKAESMSHPAIVGNQIYLRSQNELVCLQLQE
jgi:outer membrane protein assembly factor BamB